MSRKHPGTSTSEIDFFQRVYEVTRLIPSGRVTSYGAIASYIGSPGAARMVGWALNKSDGQAAFVPAHRVVNRFGLLSGKNHFSGQHVMRELLQNEGVDIEEDRVIAFQKLFWDPAKEL